MIWGDIWSESVDDSRDAKWLKDLQSEANVKKQEKVDITKESLKKILCRMPNWKSPGLYLDSGFVPCWLTRVRTVLFQKAKSKDNNADNYRPITCFPLMRQLLLGVIAIRIVDI